MFEQSRLHPWAPPLPELVEAAKIESAVGRGTTVSVTLPESRVVGA